MTATVLVWHNRKTKTTQEYWQLTNLAGQKLASVYRRPSGRWYGDLSYWRGNAPIKSVADRQPTPDAAKTSVEKHLDRASIAYFRTDEITFLTWDDNDQGEEFRGAMTGRWSADFADAERRTMAQYKQMWEATERKVATKRTLSLYDGSAEEALKDYFG